MDIFSSANFWPALGAIMMLNLVLSGDNAVVIAMAARNLPPIHQKKAIIWGTFGAVAVRVVMTLVVVYLLKIPGLKFVGGLALIWIAISLVKPEGDEDDHGNASDSFWAAMKTIMIADAVMGIDNVLAVAGAAHGNIPLVVIGLALSIPIVVFGSTIVLKLMDKFPIVIWIGAAILGATAAAMMWDEKLFQDYFKPQASWEWPFVIAVTAITLALAYWFSQSAKRKLAQTMPSN